MWDCNEVHGKQSASEQRQKEADIQAKCCKIIVINQVNFLCYFKCLCRLPEYLIQQESEHIDSASLDI